MKHIMCDVKTFSNDDKQSKSSTLSYEFVALESNFFEIHKIEIKIILVTLFI